MRANTRILTLQHASGWNYGDNFFFVDFVDDDVTDAFNESSSYMEYYGAFNGSKLFKAQENNTWLNNLSLVLGFNHAPASKVKKYLPGFRLDFNSKNFNYLNLLVTAYIDDNSGVQAGGAPKEDNSYMLDVVFSRTWNLSQRHIFSLEGHMEYIGKRKNEFSETVASWVLAQPQLRYDMGNFLWNKKDALYTGLKYQYWRNKLGDKRTTESELLFLLVWRL